MPVVKGMTIAADNPTGKVLKDDGTWVTSTSQGGSAWGEIAGTLSAQTDLQEALNNKSDGLHNHDSIYESANTNIQAHVISGHAPSNAQKNSDITKVEIEAKLTGEISSHSHPGGSGGLGYVIQFECPNQATTTDSQTVYWGSKNLAQQTTADIHRIYIPKAGTIKVCYIHAHAGTAGTNENWSMNIRKNNSADTLVQTLGISGLHRVWSNVALSIAVVAGDYIEIKEVQPTWSTNPANVRRSGVIYIE